MRRRDCRRIEGREKTKGKKRRRWAYGQKRRKVLEEARGGE
jgi:hypothetical protein